MMSYDDHSRATHYLLIYLGGGARCQLHGFDQCKDKESMCSAALLTVDVEFLAHDCNYQMIF